MTDYFDARLDAAYLSDPALLVTACIEAGQRSLLIDLAVLPSSFFDLSTGLAGAFVQRLRNYSIRAALIVPDRTVYSQRFQEFAAEADRGSTFRVFRDKTAAVSWLTQTSALSRPIF